MDFFLRSLFFRNSQRVLLTVSVEELHCLLIFDEILNVILPEELFTTGVTQGNLELPLPPIFLASHKNTKTIR